MLRCVILVEPQREKRKKCRDKRNLLEIKMRRELGEKIMKVRKKTGESWKRPEKEKEKN